MREFKLIVAGGRDYNNYPQAASKITEIALEELADYAVSIVSGMARGADRIGYQFAQRNNVQCYEFPADWNRYGRAAGYRRNEAMAEFADGLLAFWDGQSRGTKHMIESMQRLNKRVWVVYY